MLFFRLHHEYNIAYIVYNRPNGICSELIDCNLSLSGVDMYSLMTIFIHALVSV
jgi:hypothetical protein